MLKEIRLTLLVVSSFIFLGCALTVDKIPLNYSAPEDIFIMANKCKKGIIVQNIVDNRSIPNPTYILQKRNGYGMIASGAFEAEREVTVIITDALKDVLEKNKYNLKESGGEYLIKGKLSSIDEDYVMGFWAGNLKLKMEIELSLVDTQKKETVWKEFFVAHGISKKTVSTKTAIQTAFEDVVNDFLKQFVQSDFVSKIK